MALSGCGAVRRAGPSTSQMRDVTGTTGVVLSTAGSLVIETGAEAERIAIDGSGEVVGD